ncbi:MAG: hypothetical protein NE330_02035, partial [Lentisphaeraceae bacterium]|nr:hypothetical protein [Lentisphaeraceae bacterium]
ITDEEASHMYYKHMKKAIIDTRRHLRKKELEHTFLRINDFCVLLKLTDLPKSAEIDTTDWAKIEKKISVQIETYGPIHHAKVKLIKSGNETQKVCNYHHLPSIIPKQVDFITLSGITKSIEGMVPLESFLEAMKDKLIDLDICYYIPEVNLHKEEEIFNQLNGVRVAVPQEEVIEEPEEEKIDPFEMKEKVASIVNQIIKSFRAGDPEATIIFNICSNPASQDIDKKVAHATIDLFNLIQKNESLVNEPEKLI